MRGVCASKALKPQAASCICRPQPSQYSTSVPLAAPRGPHSQVCNHPELFEGQAERWPLQFADSSTAIDDALQPIAPVVLAGPGRPPKAPAGTTWVQVTGFRSHIQVSGPLGPVFLFHSPSDVYILLGLPTSIWLPGLLEVLCLSARAGWTCHIGAASSMRNKQLPGA